MIDSDERKVQFWLKNSLIDVEYTADDVNEKERSKEWHEKHLTDLADYVIDLLETADSVPDYLASHPSIFTPRNLLKN